MKVVLAKVPVTTITIEVARLKPTKWDHRVIQNDYNRYVALVRHVSAGTPDVIYENGAIYLINGLPFVTAAKAADPSLAEIIVRLFNPPSKLEPFGVRPVNPTDLLNVLNRKEQVPQLLSFSRNISSGDEIRIRNELQGFSDSVRNAPDCGCCSNPNGFTLELYNRFHWYWSIWLNHDHYMQKYIELCWCINRDILPIRSLNGFALLDPLKAQLE